MKKKQTEENVIIPEFKNKNAFFKALGYNPHKAQKQFHNDKSRYKILIAGSRFGKSLAASYEVAYLSLKPNIRGWIVAPTYFLGEKEFRYIFEIFVEKLPKVVPGLDAEQIAKASTYSKNLNSMKIMLPWGSEIHVRSAERPYTLLGEEIDWLLLSEAAQLKIDVWDRYLRARLVSRKGKLIIPSTPAGKNWLYPMYLRGQNDNHPKWKSWQFATAENPHVDPKEIEEARLTMPEDVFAEQFMGEFITKTGRVYPEFSRSTHVTEFDIAKLPIGTRFFRCFDFGYTNPTAVLFCALTREDVLYVYDEFYQRERTTNEIIEEVKRKSRDRMFEQSYADPSAAREINDLRSSGISVTKAPNNLTWGINAIRERLMPAKNKEFRLIVHPKCQKLIFEFEHYKYPEQTSEVTLQENPIKAHDHALDALRYLVSSLKKNDQKLWKVL